MKFKTAEHDLPSDSTTTGVTFDEANVISLYDDLLAFTDLSPEEQKAAMNSPALIDPSQESSDAFFFEPPVETAKDSIVDAIVKEPDCESPSQINLFDKDGNADIRLAEILKVTGQLADSPISHDSSLICGDCGSLADSEDVFCVTCGGPLEDVERAAVLYCSDCGLTIVSDEIFCPSCGSAMLDQ